MQSDLETPYDLSEAEASHFRSHAWAQSLLTSSLQDGQGDYIAIRTGSRSVKQATGEDGFFAGTLQTASTIPFLVTLRRRDLRSVTAALPPEAPVMDPKAKKSFTPSRPPDTITLVSLGTPGVSGHPSTAHGGLVATLFDEVQSIAMTLHLPPISPGEEEDLATRGGHTVYTAQLNVRYKAPVLVPGLLVIRSWCVARNGRKTWTIAQALQEDEADGQGHLEWTKRKRVRADSAALWIDVSVQPKL